MLISELPAGHAALNVSNLLRNSSLQRMQQHSGITSFQLADLQNPNDLVYGHWMAMILISGEANGGNLSILPFLKFSNF